MWIYILAFLYCLPLFVGALYPLQQDAPTIFGKATAIDVDLLKVKGDIVVLRGVEAVAYKRRAEEREPAAELQARLDRGPVRCERLEKYNGKDWHVGTCYLLVGKGIEIDLNQWVVASGFSKAMGDDYREDEQLAREAGRGMWKRRVRLGTGGHPWEEPTGAARRRGQGEIVGD